MPIRTIRKSTRWTADEWAQVEAHAQARGVPPLRFVREAALGAPAAPHQTKRTHARDPLLVELSHVLNNLGQLRRVAEINGYDEDAARIAATARAVEDAARPAPAGAVPTPLLTAAGVVLNQLARRANTFDELPLDSELAPVLADVERACARTAA
jgi:hypothetical protein